jgi:hypothetical protein
MMGYKLKGRIVTAILLSLLLFSAFSSYAEEKEKRFEILFSGGAAYATSRTAFSVGTSFSYHLKRNIVLSVDIGTAHQLPYLDFPEIVKLEEGYRTMIRVENRYRLFSSLSAEYSFDVSPRIKPFVTAGVGWCRDYTHFDLGVVKLKPTEDGVEWEPITGIPFQLDESITCSADGDCKYRKSDFPLLIVGGGIRCSLGSNTFLKVMVRVMDPGGDFATYQSLIGWGIRF